MNQRSRSRLIIGVLLILPIVVSFSEPSELPGPPGYEFLFGGQVTDDEGAPLANYTVAALRDSVSLPEGWGLLTPGFGYQRYFVTVSDNSGRFRLPVSLQRAPDSLGIGIVTPDTILVGFRIARRTIPYWTEQRTYSYDKGGFCGGTTSITAPVAYVYDSIDTLDIVVPAEFTATIPPPHQTFFQKSP